MIGASVTGDDDNPAFVRLPVDKLLHARRAFLAREGEEKFRDDGGQRNGVGGTRVGSGAFRRR